MTGSIGVSEDETKKEELQQLLDSWNVGYLFEQFLAQKIFVNILKIMERKHIRHYFKSVLDGDKILFEYKLTEWRKSIGIPLEEDLLTEYRNTPTTAINSPTTSTRSLPMPRTPTLGERAGSEDSENSYITLGMILNTTARGQFVASQYDTNKKFGEEQRKLLINTIVSFFEEKQIDLSLRDSRRIEKEIVDRFPSESLDYYRTSARGRIYNKYSNNKRLYPHSPRVLIQPEQPQNMLDSEQNAEDIVRIIKYDNLSVEEFDKHWQACTNFRLKQIKESPSTSDALEKWPDYKKPLGYRLIDMDFKALHSSATSFLDTWPEQQPKIVKFLSKDQNLKERRLVLLLEELIQDKIEENARDVVVMHLMHGFLIPTQKTVLKDKNGKKSTVKYTIRDSQESFLFLCKSAQEVEEHIQHLKSRSQSIQPFLIGIGESITKLKEYFLYFDNVKYHFTSYLRGVDILFKLFHVFNLEYPLPSTNFYLFLQQYIFNMKCSKRNQKNALMGNELL